MSLCTISFSGSLWWMRARFLSMDRWTCYFQTPAPLSPAWRGVLECWICHDGVQEPWEGQDFKELHKLASWPYSRSCTHDWRSNIGYWYWPPNLAVAGGWMKLEVCEHVRREPVFEKCRRLLEMLPHPRKTHLGRNFLNTAAGVFLWTARISFFPNVWLLKYLQFS